MNSLPHEVSEEIFSYLSRQSKCVCSLVCKSWYSILTPLLYNVIYMPSDRALNLFRRTIEASLQTCNLNNLVKHIRFFTINVAVVIRKKTAFVSKPYLTQLANLLPNIQTMITHYSIHGEICLDVNEYQNIWEHLFTMSDKEYIEYLYVKIPKICNIQFLVRDGRACKKIEYPIMTPSLKCLMIWDQQIPNTMNLLPCIIQTYPQLINLTLESSCDAEYIFGKKIDVHTSLFGLCLTLSRFYSHHIQCIKDTFVNLMFLHLSVISASHDGRIITEIFSAFRSQETTLLTLYDFTEKEQIRALYDFWALIHTFRDECKNELYVKNISSVLKLQKHNFAKANIVVLSTLKSSPFHLFGDWGQFIEKLEFDNFPEPINMKELNKLFPNLKELLLTNNSLDINLEDLPEANLNMEKMVLDFACFNQPYICELPNIYPNLTRLNISFSELFSTKTKSLENQSYTIKIPWETIEELYQVTETDIFDIWKVVVVKRIEGVILEIWFYEDYNYTRLDNELVTDDYLDSVKGSLIIIEASSIGFITRFIH